VTPYAQGKRWTLYAGDCLGALVAMPDRSVAAIITDPPYCAGAVSESGRTAAAGQGLRSENIQRFGWFVGDNMGTAGLAFLLRSMAFEGLRVCDPTGSMLVFCDWRMSPTLAPTMESAGWRYQNLVVWDKGSMGLGTGFRAQHEMILHYTAGAPAYHNKGTGNVIRCGRVGAEDREHQTEKPVDLIRSLVRVVAPRDGVVLDPFAGSGAIGVGALLEGRRFVGVERDRNHLATAARRLTDAEAGGVQSPLFGAA
jgi:DNA modification methylase